MPRRWICDNCHKKTLCKTDPQSHVGRMMIAACHFCKNVVKCFKCPFKIRIEDKENESI